MCSTEIAAVMVVVAEKTIHWGIPMVHQNFHSLLASVINEKEDSYSVCYHSLCVCVCVRERERACAPKSLQKRPKRMILLSLLTTFVCPASHSDDDDRKITNRLIGHREVEVSSYVYIYI